MHSLVPPVSLAGGSVTVTFWLSPSAPLLTITGLVGGVGGWAHTMAELGAGARSTHLHGRKAGSKVTRIGGNARKTLWLGCVQVA